MVNGGAVLECGNCLPPSVCPNQGGRLNTPLWMLFRLKQCQDIFRCRRIVQGDGSEVLTFRIYLQPTV